MLPLNHVDNASERAKTIADRKKAADEEAERKRFEGTRVTVESFMKWSLAFEKEMEELRVKREGKDQTIGKLSGKELFQVDSKLIDSDLSFLEGS